jgi:hypothetical protein
MPDAAFYRAEAKRCRNLAVSANDAVAAKHWHQMADEYALLAEKMDDVKAHRTPTLTTRAARQLLDEHVKPKSRS